MTTPTDETRNEVSRFEVRGEYAYCFGKTGFEKRQYDAQTANEAIGKARDEGLVELISAYRV